MFLLYKIVLNCVILGIKFDVVFGESGPSLLRCVENHKRNLFFNDRENCTLSNVQFLKSGDFNLLQQYDEEAATISKLVFENSIILYMPRKLFSELENLRVLYMPRSNLMELKKYDFKDATNLQMITLSDNNLERLPDSVFYGADQLGMLDLSRNRITTIASGAFKHLNNLYLLEISANHIKMLPDNLFASNPRIDYLNLSENFLKILSQKLTAHLKLNILSVNKNELEYLEIDNNVGVLDASDNKLTNLKLHIAGNRNNGNVKLEILKLSRNQLTNLEFIKNLTNLIELDVSGNRLTIIPNDTFTNLAQLQRLHLSAINLLRLNFRIFSSLQNLVELDISNNRKLSHINFESDSGMHKLKKLYLNGLNVKNMAATNFAYLFPELRFIDISDNAWPCSDLRAMLNALSRLNIELTTQSHEELIVLAEDKIRGIYCYSNEDTSEKPFTENLNSVRYFMRVNDELVAVRNRLDRLEMHLDLAILHSEHKPFGHVHIKILFVLAFTGFAVIFFVIKFGLRQCQRNRDGSEESLLNV